MTVDNFGNGHPRDIDFTGYLLKGYSSLFHTYLHILGKALVAFSPLYHIRYRYCYNEVHI